MKYEVQEVLYEKKLGKGEHGVYKVEHIHIQYMVKVETEAEGKKKKKVTKQAKTLCLRLVWYKDEEGRKYKLYVWKRVQLFHSEIAQATQK